MADYSDIAPYLRGAVELEAAPGGLVRPRRFLPKQVDVLRKCGRARRGMATAGVALDFMTDGSRVAFDCLVLDHLQPQHPLYREVMEHEGALGRADEGVVDGIDVVVSAAPAPAAQSASVAAATSGSANTTTTPSAPSPDSLGPMPVPVETRSYTLPVDDGRIECAFPNPDHARVEVKVWLPDIMSVAVGYLETDGSLEPAPARPYLLALGDSITQGFVVGSPSLAYPAQAAGALGLDLLNQGIAGHVFDLATLRGLTALRDTPPVAISVAYGTNDWSRTTSAAQLRRDAERYLDKLVWTFPDVPIYLLSPLWRVDEDTASASGKPLMWMGEMLREVCAAHGQVRFIDGYPILPRNSLMLADGRLHPGPVAASLVADELVLAMAADAIGG